MTTYSLRGRVRAQRFVASAPSLEHENESPGTLVGGPSAPDAPSSSLPQTTCEYTDEANVYYSGTCATQQEIDDAYIAMVAMEDDAGGVQTDGTNDIYHCQTVLNQCWETVDSEAAAPSAEDGIEGAEDDISYLRTRSRAVLRAWQLLD